MSAPRASTDEESAPLLQSNRSAPPTDNRNFFSALTHPTRQLTNLEKVLAAAGIALLVLTGTFVGLFTGAEVALGKERAKGGGRTEWRTETKTVATTTTATTTKTSAGSTVTSVPTGKPAAEICVTPDCVHLAAAILDTLDTSVDPCDDFYQYANGGWLASHDIPADRGMYSAFNALFDRNKEIIRKVLNAIPSEEKSTISDDNDADKSNRYKLKAVYDSCLDTETLNEAGTKPLVPLVKTVIDKFGSFDVSSSEEDASVTAGSEWEGAHDQTFKVSAGLLAKGNKVEVLRLAKKQGRVALGRFTSKPVGQLEALIDEETLAHKNNSDGRQARITETLAYLHSRGVDALIDFQIEGDAGGEDPQVQSLSLYQSFGGLPSKEYYEEKPILDLYQSVIGGILTEVAKHTGSKNKRDLASVIDDAFEVQGWPWPWPGDDKPDKKPENPDPSKDDSLEKRMDRLAGKIVAFEQEISRAGTDPEYILNPTYAYNPYPTEKVDKALSFLNIPTYLSTYAPRSFPANITVTYPPYLKSISKLVDNTPDYVLAGYFVSRLAMTYADVLGPKSAVRIEMKRLSETLKGIKKGTEENRVDLCLGYVDSVVGYLAGREFVRDSFSPEAKQEGEDIINAIVDAFYNKLPHISWMDKESASAAQKKAKAIIPKVGYPLTPNTTDPESLQRWYSRTPIKGDDFFGNVLRSTVTDVTRSWMSLGQKRDRQSWEMTPQTVNAYYSPPDGEIVFPAGILQPPFFSKDWPSHFNYGAFGAVAAHELTHAFDNAGSQYDERGRIRQWWTNSTTKAFEEKAQCIAKQYSKYFVLDAEGKKEFVNGNLTNGEDIADSGLAQAYIAWKESSSSPSKDKHAKPTPRLPGLDYTDEQLFFISFARIWANKMRPEVAVSRVRTDPHSPAYWRVMGTLRNSDAFHEAFKCKSGSKMNPVDQCKLW